MPRNLSELNDDERRALLNAHWQNLINSELALPTGITEAIPSPLEGSSTLPSDLADHLVPGVGGAAGRIAPVAWTINGSCLGPDVGGAGRISLPGQ